MHLARLARLDDEAHAGAHRLAHEVVVHARRRRAGRGWRACVAGEVAVAEDQQLCPSSTAWRAWAWQLLERASRAPPRPRPPEEHRQRRRPKSADVAGRGSGPGPRWRGSGCGSLISRHAGAVSLEDVALAAEEGHQRHHQLLADRIDGRVGHLREELLEVPVEQLRLLERTASGASVPIEPTGSLPVARHGRQMISEVLARVAEGRSGAASDCRGPATRTLAWAGRRAGTSLFPRPSAGRAGGARGWS